jgi:cytochrome c oxidase cbb3-type subunit 1
VITTIAIEFVVTTVIINFFMTLRGSGDKLRTSLPIRWYYTGMVLYFTTCLQCSFQTTLTFQRIIHFTDWVVAHAHLVMFGVFGFWLIGFTLQFLPRVVGRVDWYSRRLLEWHYWLTTVAMVAMFFDLTIAGLIQGYQWRDLAPWESSLSASYPFWLVRSFTGVMMIVAQGIWIYDIVMTVATKRVRAAEQGERLEADGELAPA